MRLNLKDWNLPFVISGMAFLLTSGLIFSMTSTVITVYNTIIKSKVWSEQALNDLDSVYQRRYALVDNLVSIVKETKLFEQYQIEIEKELYPRVAAMKAQATKSEIKLPVEVSKRIVQEDQLQDIFSHILDKLFVLAQHYPTISDPTLKDRMATFDSLKELRESLKELEGDIQRQRQVLNNAIRIYNQNLKIFPANVLVKWWNLTPLAGFEVLSPKARQDVKVEF